MKNNSVSQNGGIIDREHGFTLVELIIAIGLLSIFSVIGVISYSKVTENSKQTAVNSAAKEVYQDAIVRHSSQPKTGSPDEADDDWNNSAGEGSKITTKLENLGSGNFKVTAIYDDTEIYAVYPSSAKTGNEIIPPPPVDPNEAITTKFTMNCDERSAMPLPIEKPDSKATVFIDGTQYSVGKELRRFSFWFNANRDYSVTVIGKFDAFYHNGLGSCLSKIEKIGEESGITAIKNLGQKITDVPDTIPSSVVSLDHAFSGSKLFNSSNVSSWDTSNVTNMDGTFHNTAIFNQDLSNWNTENVTTMRSMFHSAKAFNQPIGDWDTGNVTDMAWMFYATHTFNQPIGNWNTENVTTMRSMFHSAYVFNQPIGDWNTKDVTDMSSMFNYAKLFNQDIGGWNTGNVTDMTEMFFLARQFKQDLSSWNVEKIPEKPYLFEPGTLKTNNYLPNAWQ